MSAHQQRPDGTGLPPMPPAERVTLANGLQLVLQPMPASTSVGALLTVRVGARHEPPALSGISHFLEHMVFRGTERWDEDELRAVITRRGGWHNGWTGREDTTYATRVAAHDWRLAVEWLAQLVFHPTLPEAAVEKERRIIRQEKAGRESRLVRVLSDIGLGYDLDTALRKALFPHPSFAQPVIGEDRSLDRIDRAALLAHHRHAYHPNQCALVVAGPLDGDQLRALVEQLCGDLPAGPPRDLPPTPPLPAPASGPVIVRGPEAADRVRVRVAARTVGCFHPDRWALSVLAQVLSERLKRAIRRQRGLAYGVAVGVTLFEDAGMWRVRTSADRRHQHEILGRIDQEIRAAATAALSQREIHDAQTALMGGWALSMEDSFRRASWLAQWASPLALPAGAPDYHEVIGAVTREDVARVAATYLAPERRVVGLHLPIATVPGAVTWASGAACYGAGLWLAGRRGRR